MTAMNLRSYHTEDWLVPGVRTRKNRFKLYITRLFMVGYQEEFPHDCSTMKDTSLGEKEFSCHGKIRCLALASFNFTKLVKFG